MKIFITGASGLVGRNISEVLKDDHQLFMPTHAELDLLNRAAVRAYVEGNVPDMVIHCAGRVGGIQANIKEPVRFLVENIEMGKNVVLSSAEVGVKALLNLGSSCMYPRNAPNPLCEDEILKGELEPTNEGYALAKIAVHRLCRYISMQDPSFQYKTIIPCNLYGKWDKFDQAHSHMVPGVIRKLHEARKKGNSSVEIWGSGKVRREFMYAGDLADFVRYAIENYEKMPDPLNVGLGYDYSIDEYYEVIAKVIGYTGKFTYDTSKPEGMTRKLVDIERLKSFGWRAKISLEEGIRKTYEYFLRVEK